MQRALRPPNLSMHLLVVVKQQHLRHVEVFGVGGPLPRDVGAGDVASAAALWSGSDVAQVLAAGAALTVALLVLSLLITWLLAARSRPDPKAVFFAVFDDRVR